MTIKNFLKKVLHIKIIYFLIFLRDLPKTIKIYYPKIILKFLITNIFDQKNKKMFSMRNLGGSTISRGFHIFKTDKEIAEWIEHFEKNSLMIDVGANVGLYSLFAAYKNHKVIALEPESLNFACLNLNIQDNKFHDLISAFPIAANDEKKISFLNMSKIKFGSSGHSFDRETGESGEALKTVYKQGSLSMTIDDLVETLKISVNHIKIDVDGNELKVVNGMIKTIKQKNLKSICIELNPNYAEHQNVLEILKKNFPKYQKIYKRKQINYNYFFKKE